MGRPEFKVTFGDVFSPIYVETELLFYKTTDPEKVAVELKKIMKETLTAQRRFFIQELSNKLSGHVLESFSKNQEYLESVMFNDANFFKEYTGRRFNFESKDQYLTAIKEELQEERVMQNMLRYIDKEAIQIEDFDTIDMKLVDFIEESMKTLSDVNNTKESTDFEFKIFYDTEDYLANRGKLNSTFPYFLKNAGITDYFYEVVNQQVFSIIIFVLKNDHTYILR